MRRIVLQGNLGIDICERLPEQAKLADRFAIVRSMTFTQPDHRAPEELMTGFMGRLINVRRISATHWSTT